MARDHPSGQCRGQWEHPAWDFGDRSSTGIVHDALHKPGLVAPELTFEITYLKCAEGYGWATIVAPDIGEGGTVFFEGSGNDLTVLDLGTSVCPTEAGMPESIAIRLAPPGSHWRWECGLASAG